IFCYFFFFQAEDGIRDFHVTGVQTCALPISMQTRTGYYLRKFMGHFEEASQYSDVQRDYILFRYTEVILNYVEAKNEADGPSQRSEERRVGKECRSRWWPNQ